MQIPGSTASPRQLERLWLLCPCVMASKSLRMPNRHVLGKACILKCCVQLRMVCRVIPSVSSTQHTAWNWPERFALHEPRLLYFAYAGSTFLRIGWAFLSGLMCGMALRESRSKLFVLVRAHLGRGRGASRPSLAAVELFTKSTDTYAEVTGDGVRIEDIDL